MIKEKVDALKNAFKNKLAKIGHWEEDDRLHMDNNEWWSEHKEAKKEENQEVQND